MNRRAITRHIPVNAVLDDADIIDAINTETIMLGIRVGMARDYQPHLLEAHEDFACTVRRLIATRRRAAS